MNLEIGENINNYDKLGDYYELNTIYPYPYFCSTETLRETNNIIYNEHMNSNDYKNKLGNPNISQKDIDIDSFLKKITYATDKCYYNNYKPNFTPPVRVDYNTIEEANFVRASLNSHSCGRLSIPQTCGNPSENKLKYDMQDYCQNYICDKPFNNYTKRKYIINKKHK